MAGRDVAEGETELVEAGRGFADHRQTNLWRANQVAKGLMPRDVLSFHQPFRLLPLSKNRCFFIPFYVLVSQYLSHFSKNITLSKKIIARFFPILMTRFKTLREYLKALQTFYHAFNLITGIHALNLNTGFFALKL